MTIKLALLKSGEEVISDLDEMVTDKQMVVGYYFQNPCRAILSFILILSFGIVGMFISLIIPAIKELYYDKYLGKGCCEWADYFYSIAPTIMLAIMKYQ